ncbi:type VI secretion system protein IglI family protein [Paraliomyxa miuraensis]|uniref:type VI secretion system protein IglI family protein n=1 Tax=Paraliomyxa miuraensis TaxID=376150 RepID=UPI002254906C|nr:type VI secretion system protein IglI family protein [Paraliomyxa miuraensis]MCX4244125.1 hypothetical protein [Paraliomyxa miuraensis]
MSTRLELPPNLLDTRRPMGPPVDGQTRSTIHQLAQLADRGECIEAAAQAVDLLRGDVYDVRLACVYLMGLFAERGVAYLPRLLRTVGQLVANDVTAPPLLRSTPRVIDTSLQWLFQGVMTHIQFHQRQRDQAWLEWLREGPPTLPAELGDGVEELARTIGEVVDQPSCAGPLARIGRWARGDLMRARSRAAEKDAAARALAEAAPPPAREPEPEPEPEPDEPEPFGDAVEFDELDEPEPWPARHGRGVAGLPEPWPARHELDAPESAALSSLRRKLHGFERLVERGRFARAAIVAQDVQRIIERFDPVEFLPALFAGYFRVLSERRDDLRPHLDRADDTPWQALSRFYQADLEGFLDD